MNALLRAELLKLRTTRTFAALVGTALGLSLLVVGLVSAFGEDFTEDDVRGLFTFDLTALFILLLGVIGMAGEWRHRTITSAVLAAPDRLRFLAAKTLSFAVAGVALSLVLTVSIMALGTAILSARDEPTIAIADMADVLWRNLLVAALLGAIGVCVGALVRNQVVAIVGLLVLVFVVEPIVLTVAFDVGRFGPTVGAPNGIIDVDSSGDEDLLAPALAVLVMLAWVGVLFAAAAARLQRRDLV
jgi:ABC-type transport system involved in multi-copper enzyme maturation permease subunit